MKPTIDLTGLDISAALDVAGRDFDRTMARTLKRDVEEWRASGANADAIAAMTEMCRARW